MTCPHLGAHTCTHARVLAYPPYPHALAPIRTMSGVCLLNAPPPTSQAGGVQERLKPSAVLSLLGYAVGLPMTFIVLLVKHRESILADQALKVAGQGGTEATNPYFHIRMQFQELYRCAGGG
jgi:hypothetical protein